MLDVVNNQGKNRKCNKCKEKETTEHILECQREGMEIRTEWLKETTDINIVRKVNEWIKKEINNRIEQE